jgi:hypothetical protein
MSVFFKTKNGSKMYLPPFVYTTDENGEQKTVELSEEEKMQRCYEALVDDFRRCDFDKNIVSLISNFESIEGWEKIEVKIDLGNGNRKSFGIHPNDLMNSFYK